MTGSDRTRLTFLTSFSPATAGPMTVGPVAVGPVAVGPVAVGPVAVGPVAATVPKLAWRRAGRGYAARRRQSAR